MPAPCKRTCPGSRRSRWARSFHSALATASAWPRPATSPHCAPPTQPGKIAPIFAQQSVRENDRLHRTPDAVMVAAIWSIFAADWRRPWGADADHVKEPVHVAPFVAAGYTFFTVDPSDHVDNAAQTDDLATLRQKVARRCPGTSSETSYAEAARAYCERAHRARRADAALHRGDAAARAGEVRSRHRPHAGDHGDAARCVGRGALRPGSFGGRDRHADFGIRALFHCQ